MSNLLSVVYGGGLLSTFVYLTFFDDYIYNSWNWLIVLPLNMFMGVIWPIYWGLLHWL